VITQVGTDVVTQIVQAVFLSMLELEVSPDETLWELSMETLTSFVELSGEWTGVLLLECTAFQACQFAARFLSVAPPATVDEEVRDVLGELANMIGGNLKCAMASGLELSMPRIMKGNDYHRWLGGFEIEDRLAFQSAVGTFWVTLLSDRRLEAHESVIFRA
jgi:chemotaxis protein CheX